MTWNHRVFRWPKEHEPGEFWYDIREAHYHAPKDTVPIMRTVDAIRPGGDTLSELSEELSMMLKACSQPVLEVVDGKIVEVKP